MHFLWATAREDSHPPGEVESPVLGLFGADDRCNPVEAVEQFDQLLDESGIEHEVIIYPNSGHAFFRARDPENCRPDAAGNAWERLKKFFQEHLH